MRASTSLVLLSLAAAAGLACSSTDEPTWTCANVGVPNGSDLECTARSSNALDGPYQCNVYGDYNPNCPPSDVDAGDGGTTDFNADGGGTGDIGDSGTTPPGSGSDGGTTTPPGSGSDGGTGDGVPDSGAGADSGACHGNGCVPGHDRDSGSGPPGSGSDGGTSGPPGAGSDGGTSGPPGSSGDGGTGDVPPPWQCDSTNGNITCHRPPKCDPGTHSAPCGACVPNGSQDDCVPPPEGGCWVTGGGFIIDTDGKDTFGGNGMPMRSGVVRGEWEHQDHGTGDAMHGQVAYLYCRVVPGAGPGHPNGPQHNFDINQVYYGGPGRWMSNGAWSDGYWFDIVAEDHGEPGRADFYQITVRKYASQTQSGPIVYQTSGLLAGGNIQIHPPNAGHPYSSPAMPPWVLLQP